MNDAKTLPLLSVYLLELHWVKELPCPGIFRQCLLLIKSPDTMENFYSLYFLHEHATFLDFLVSCQGFAISFVSIGENS